MPGGETDVKLASQFGSGIFQLTNALVEPEAISLLTRTTGGHLQAGRKIKVQRSNVKKIRPFKKCNTSLLEVNFELGKHFTRHRLKKHSIFNKTAKFGCKIL